MINKRISKITMLTALFIGGIVNAQEFYTCVPKKNTIMNININNVDELAKAIIKVGGGGTNVNQNKWKLITKIDFKTTGIQVGDILDVLDMGIYKFKIFFKFNDKIDIFENILSLKTNDAFKLQILKDRTAFCKTGFYNLLYGYDKTNAIYLNKNSKCNKSDDAGLVSINLNKTCLFIYECLEEFNDCRDVDKVLKDSILEIYKKNGD